MSVSAPLSTDPLDIRFENYVPGTSRSELESQISPSTRPRIQSIDITSTGRNVAQELVDVIGTSCLPRLTSLSLSCYSEDVFDESGDADSDMDDTEGEGDAAYTDPDERLTVVATLPIQAPALQNAALRNVNLPWGPPWFPQLTRLKIDITGRLSLEQRPLHKNVRDVLTAMHSLEHLFLGDMFPHYTGSLLSVPARINLSNTCRSVTLRITEQHWDSMRFIPSLALPPTCTSPLNLVLTCNTDCTEFVKRLTSHRPRAVRIHGCDPFEELGCGTLGIMRDAAAWLASPTRALSSNPSPSTRVRFRITPPDQGSFDLPENRDDDVARFAHGLKAINLSQVQALHLQGFTHALLEPLLTGDEIEKTSHPLLRDAQHVEVLIISGHFAYRPSVFYNALAGQNSMGTILCPRLRTLVVTTSMWPDPSDLQNTDSKHVYQEICGAVERFLQARISAGFPLHTLQLPRSLESHGLCTRISGLVQIEFFDQTLESAHESAMEWDWQAWPPID